ncbi:MAG: adenosine deaminase, partial [Nitrospirota bacterium]
YMNVNSLGNPILKSINKQPESKSGKEVEPKEPDEVILSGENPADLPASKLDKLFKHQSVKAMNKVDLHRHIEGSLTPEMVLNIAMKHNIVLPTYDLEALKPMVQVTKEDKTLIDFLKKFHVLGKLFVSKEAISDITYDVIQEANKDNVKYLELRFSPSSMAGNPKYGRVLDIRKDVMEGVLEGVKKAASSFDTKVNLTMIASRKLGIDSAMDVLNLAKEYRDKGISSVDLAGDEATYGPDEFVPFFLEAEKSGFYTTGHGAEARGAESALTLKKDGHVDRVGHGVRIYQNPEIEEKAKKEHWTLELCPTSNEQTGAVENFSKDNYPFDRYEKEGINVTINTDDPGVSGITLTGENERVMDLYDYSLKKLEEFNLRAIDAAFISDEE